MEGLSQKVSCSKHINIGCGGIVMIRKSVLVLSMFFLMVTSVSAQTVLLRSEGFSSGQAASGSVACGPVSNGDVLVFFGTSPIDGTIPVNLGKGFTDWVEQNNSQIYTCVSSVSASIVTVSWFSPLPFNAPYATCLSSYTGSTGVVYSFGKAAVNPASYAVNITGVFPAGSVALAAWGGSVGGTGFQLVPNGPNGIQMLLSFTTGEYQYFGYSSVGNLTNETWTYSGYGYGGCTILYLVPSPGGTLPKL